MGTQAMKDKKRQTVSVQGKGKRQKKRAQNDEDGISSGEEDGGGQDQGPRAQARGGVLCEQADPLKGKIRSVLPVSNLRRANLWCATLIATFKASKDFTFRWCHSFCRFLLTKTEGFGFPPRDLLHTKEAHYMRQQGRALCCWQLWALARGNDLRGDNVESPIDTSVGKLHGEPGNDMVGPDLMYKLAFLKDTSKSNSEGRNELIGKCANQPPLSMPHINATTNTTIITTTTTTTTIINTTTISITTTTTINNTTTTKTNTTTTTTTTIITTTSITTTTTINKTTTTTTNTTIITTSLPLSIPLQRYAAKYQVQLATRILCFAQ